MISRAILDQFIIQEKWLVPLSGKDPIVKNWTNKKVDYDKVIAHAKKGENVGWVLREQDFVIDVDVKKKDGKASYAKLCELTGCDYLEPSVITPSGGFHIYLQLPKKYIGKRFRKTLETKFPGIDFLTIGSQCVIPGGHTPNGDYTWFDEDLPYFAQELAPKEIVDLIVYEVLEPESSSDLGEFEGLIGSSQSDWPEEKVAEMLEHLDPSMGNDEWVKVGMALHDWHPIEGLKLWESWSLAGSNYTPGETAKRWRSFHVGDGVTLGTINYMVKTVKYEADHYLVQEFVTQIKLADDKALQFDLIPKIKKFDCSTLDREVIAKTIQDRYKEIKNVRLSIVDIRKMIEPVDAAVRGQFIDELETPGWCKDWVYVNTHAGFVNLETLQVHKSESFNIENGCNVPVSEGGSKPSASKYVADNGFIQKVDSMAYMPTISDQIFFMNGSTVLNSFNPSTIPIEAENFTDLGLAAIERIKKHILFICGNQSDADILLQWIAHQVQYPGRQVLWAPVIQSIQGVGKSFFGEVLRACLGDRNVGTVSPDQAISNFRGWSTGVVVNILEELRVAGHNRHDAVNVLKPLITDRIIQVNDKGVKQYITYNTTNYMCFTNYRDALPLQNDDRRWWVIFVEIQALEQLSSYVGESTGTYFPSLFAAVREHGDEVRKWLLEYKITDTFMNMKQAPMTNHKQAMIDTEEASFEGYTEVKELIQEGGKYYNEQCVSSSDLFDALLMTYPEVEVTNRMKNVILKKMGFVSFGSPVKIDGKARRIWLKKQMTTDQIRDSFSDFDL